MKDILHGAAAVALLLAFLWVGTSPGCNPDPPGVDRARREAAIGDSIEQAVEARWRARTDSLQQAHDLQAEDALRANEQRLQAEREKRAAVAEADRLQRAYEALPDSLPAGERLASCDAALQSCAAARASLQRTVDAYAVEVAAQADLLGTVRDQLQAERERAEGLSQAAGHYRSAYEGLSDEIGRQQVENRRLKRRLWIERGVWIGVVTFAVTR